MSWFLGAIVIAFVMAMAIYWSTQGLFSAFLHLGLMIAAGAVALGIWQPLVIGFLLARMPSYAWGVGLLAPFALVLLLLRVISDKLIAGNMKFPPWVDSLGGLIAGSIAGILTAGIVLIGISFLPLPPTILGYHRYGVEAGGIKPVSDAFMPLDVAGITANFYDGLSASDSMAGGAFSTSSPLAQNLPDLPRFASTYRMREDLNAMLGATPGSVEVSGVRTVNGHDAKLPGDVAKALPPLGNQKLVVIETKWHNKPGVFGDDGTLRVASAQISLITKDSQKDQVNVLTPIAARWTDPTGHNELRVFTPAHQSAYAFKDGGVINWVFRVPPSQTLSALRVRMLPLSLPEANADTKTPLTKLIGPLPQPAKKKGQSGATVGQRHGVIAGQKAANLEQTNTIQMPFHESQAPLEYIDHAVKGGHGTATITAGGPSRRTIVDKIYCPDQFAMVRLKITADRAQSLFGRALQDAASVAPPLLKDNQGNNIAPIAYVLQRATGKTEDIQVRFAPFQSAKQIPFDQMRDGDVMYLYFRVQHDITITRYQISPDTHQDVHLKVN